MGYVNSADLGNNGGSTTNLTVLYTVTAGSTGLAFALLGPDNNGSDGITLFQYNNLNCLLAGKVAPSTSSNRWTYFYYLSNPPSGAHNVVVNSTNTDWLIAGVAEYNVINFSSVDAVAASTDPIVEDTYTSSINTIAASTWAILVANNQGADIVPGGGPGATMRVSAAAYTDWLIADSANGVAPGNYSMTVTLGTNFGLSKQIRVIASFTNVGTRIWLYPVA